MLVTTNMCLPQQIFVATNIISSQQTCLLSWQKNTCHVQTFVATKLCLSQQKFCCDKIFLSWQNFCRDKHTFVMTKDMFCCDVFIATKLLSRQKWYLWQLPPVIVHCLHGDRWRWCKHWHISPAYSLSAWVPSQPVCMFFPAGHWVEILPGLTALFSSVLTSTHPAVLMGKFTSDILASYPGGAWLSATGARFKHQP